MKPVVVGHTFSFSVQIEDKSALLLQKTGLH